jgi:hypothetical protein
MPPGSPRIDLAPHQDKTVNAGNKPSEITQSLLDKYTLNMKPWTIKRRLQEWQVQRKFVFVDDSLF